MKGETILKRIKEVIYSEYPNAKIVLFGSRARGDSNIQSDWDLLILLDEKVDFKKRVKINNKIYEIELEFNQIITPIIHNVAEWESLNVTAFYKNIQREGITL